ncbi:Dialkylrecorsinol condensing enzyme [hydrothermal vent metagenome]|uniref:Dialkylrecorsinol condensing enzyme n=1 Tax=hydrothermal vent metagenome TaxID=652676 RepID=A0A3B0WYR8_9ZZZZ
MKVLVLHYSQTGQLSRVIQTITEPLVNHPGIDVTFRTIESIKKYPFPWPFIEFFCNFPEAVYMDAPENKPLDINDGSQFDLIILGYQVWFLSPSLPTTALLRSDQAEAIFSGKPVITVIACRDMWLTAQEKIKNELKRLNANLIDNVVLVDEGGSGFSFLSTPLWMFTGRKGPWWCAPKAGVSESDIIESKRFGKRIVEQLTTNPDALKHPMLTGLGAVTIKEKTIASETLAHRSFLLWGKLLRAVGSPTSLARKIFVRIYIVFLIILILTLVPISALIKKLLTPFTKRRIKAQKEYYSFPSGESRKDIEKTHD